jgi:hypothetical protein
MKIPSARLPVGRFFNPLRVYLSNIGLESEATMDEEVLSRRLVGPGRKTFKVVSE